MRIIDLIVVSVISFGLSFSFSLTSGPAGIFRAIRSRLEKSKHKIFKEGSSCPVCMSFWISLVVSLAMGCGVEGWLFSWGVTCVITSLSPDSLD